MTALTKQIITELAYGRVEAIRPTRADLIAALRDRADDECDAVDAALMRMAAEMLAEPADAQIRHALNSLVAAMKAKGYEITRAEYDARAGSQCDCIWLRVEHGKPFGGKEYWYSFARSFAEQLAEAHAAIEAMEPVPDYSADFDMAVYQQAAE